MEFDFPDIVDTSTGLLTFKANNAGASFNIDKEARLVKNVKVARVGEARGHDMWVEMQFLQDAVSYAKRKMSGRVPVYMGHRWDPNFYQMGYLFNIRIEGEEILADLKIYESADLSPAGGDMPEWFFSLAAEDPSAVNLSMSFAASGMYQYDSKGDKVMLAFDYYNWRWKKVDDKGKMYVGFGSWNSTDIVHKGALTDTLFSAEEDTPASIAFTQFANSEGFIEWYKHNIDRFPQLNLFYQARSRFSLGKFFTGLFSNQSNPSLSMDPVNNPTPVAEPTTPPAIETSAAAPATDLSALQTQLTALQEQITQLQATNTAQAAEIVALKNATPAAAPVGVRSEDPPVVGLSTNPRPWENSPINREARGYASKANPK